MNNIFAALVIGIAAGTIDVIPMIIQKLNKTACISAFVHYLAMGFLIPFIQWNIAPGLKGIIIAVILSLPVMIIVGEKDKKALIPMIILAIILGAAIGIAGTKFVVL
jgi:hypothetical protein